MPNETNAGGKRNGLLLDRLREKYPGHSALAQETVYALPAALVQSIQSVIPDFFTKEEEVFEKDLVTYGGMGFYLGQPIGYLSLEQPAIDEADLELEEQSNRAVDSIRQMLIEDREAAGFPTARIEASLAPDQKAEVKILMRREGYAGWLATCAEFRKQRDAFCASIRDRVKRDGRFPKFPESWAGEPYLVAEEDREFFDIYVPFYRRWGIARMVTWDCRCRCAPFGLGLADMIRPTSVMLGS